MNFGAGFRVLLIVATVNFYPTELRWVDAQSTSKLVSIGKPDNAKEIEYFVDTSTFRTWAEASTACASAGKSLGKITTAIEWNYLKNATVKSTQYYLWTAGRDKQTTKQFTFGDNEKEPYDAVSGIMYDRRTKALSCLAVWGGKFAIMTCTSKSHILCESGKRT